VTVEELVLNIRRLEPEEDPYDDIWERSKEQYLIGGTPIYKRRGGTPWIT
jgi:hypothetical protein